MKPSSRCEIHGEGIDIHRFYFRASKQAQPQGNDVMVCRLTDKEAFHRKHRLQIILIRQM